MSDFTARQEEVDAAKASLGLEVEKRRTKDLERQLLEADKVIKNLERDLGLLEKIGHRPVPPAWVSAPPKSDAPHHGIWNFMLSDLHLDEIVQPSEVLGINAFNREIAEMRLARTFEGVIKVARDYITGVKVDGLILYLGGDIFSGIIHEELKVTNEVPILDSVDYWIGPLVAGIELMADEFGKVHVPVVVGNHGRLSCKPVAKLRARDNFDWFIGRALARNFRNDSRVTFNVSDSPDLLVPVYDKKIMLTHGDQTSGGAGIGGIWPPIMRLDARKSQRQASVGQPYDLMVMGHWHQLVFGPNWIINGSLKGLDEYAFISNFSYEVPQQAMWLMTPEHGKTFTAPVFCQDPVAEGWGAEAA